MQNYSLLLTDHYQLTMAYSHWKTGRSEQAAIFQLQLEKIPFSGNFAICAGLDLVIDFLNNFCFDSSDLAYLSNLKNENSKNIFHKNFINYLQQMKFCCDIDAIPEGTLIFQNEPILVIKGPLLQCIILETALRNFIAFSTLIATKSARMLLASRFEAIIEAGLCSAQGPNGGLIASRAAYLGGCFATSNVLASREFGLPLKGDMDHNWVKSFPGELEAFRGFAEVMLSQTSLVLDTFNLIKGLDNAIQIGTELRRCKHDLFAVIINSNNAIKYSKQVRKTLAKAGFTNTKIIVNGNLDEYAIKKLKGENVAVDIWNVGGKLVSAFDQPILDVSYKFISANGDDQNANQAKTQQIRRFYKKDKLAFDIVYDSELGISEASKLAKFQHKDLLVPIFRAGEAIYNSPSLPEIRNQAIAELKLFRDSKIGKLKVLIDDNLKELQNKLAKSMQPSH